jgi:hypothetical protein
MSFFRKRQAPFYQFVAATQMPTPGAMEYGFESEMLAWRPVIGPAIAARFQFRTLQNPQAMQNVAVWWTTGLGGLAHGQSALQPLSNPWQASGG